MWKGLYRSIEVVRDNLDRHKRLVEAQASLVHFEEMKKEREFSKGELVRIKEELMRMEEEMKKARESSKEALVRMEESMQQTVKTNVATWLHPPNSRHDYEKYSKVHTGYPGTGKWLLKNKNVRKWVDHTNADVTLIWLHAGPGAGTYTYFYIIYVVGIN